jgi:hypothetical protein
MEFWKSRAASIPTGTASCPSARWRKPAEIEACVQFDGKILKQTAEISIKFKNISGCPRFQNYL